MESTTRNVPSDRCSVLLHNLAHQVFTKMYQLLLTTTHGHEEMTMHTIKSSEYMCFHKTLFYWNLQFLNNVIIITTKILLTQAYRWS
jgi:hypothetical protein